MIKISRLVWLLFTVFFGAAVFSASAAAQCVSWNEPKPYGSLPPRSDSGNKYLALARYWAPVISQDIDAYAVRADYITNFDFDLDKSAANNWDNLNKFDMRSYVYYWVIETRERYLIGYAFFHPRDWEHSMNSSLIDQHVNDLEGVVVSVLKDKSDAKGRFEALYSEAHGTNFGFADDDTPDTSPFIWRVAPSKALKGEDEDVDFVVDDAGFHPVVYIQARGHGTYGHPFRSGTNVWHFMGDWIPIFITNKVTDWRGKNFAGLPTTAQLGTVSASDRGKNWGDGIVYHYEHLAEDLAPANLTAKDKLPHDWQVAGYDLLSIKWLWDCRHDNTIFKGNAGEFLPKGANPPWGWGSDGDFFTDPAALMNRQFKNIVPPATSCSYTGNSFDASQGGCPKKN